MCLKLQWRTCAVLLGILQLTQSAFFDCYRSTSIDDYIKISFDKADTIIDEPWFYKDLPFVVYVFGFKGKQNGTATTSVLEALLALDDRNVCLCNWEKEAALLPGTMGPATNAYYPVVVQQMYKVAYELAAAIAKMVDAGLNLTKTHLVGHSLGGQMIGKTGSTLRKQYELLVGKITALDPAGPGFYRNSAVTISSGHFVVNLHTDPYGYGTSEATGHVDVFPRTVTSGSVKEKHTQPGCETSDIQTELAIGDLCSHDRSWMLFIESLTDNSLQACKADSEEAWINNEGNCTETITLGDDTNLKARGKYYLQTESYFPFGMYEAGLRTSSPFPGL